MLQTKFKLPLQRKYMSNGNKNTISLEANVMNITAKFKLYPNMASEELIFQYLFANLTFQLSCRQKFSGLDKNGMLGRSRNITFVKISAAR